MAYALHQCRYFILGCRYFILGCMDLIVATDHKPLVHVLNDRSLSDIQNRRLQNLKEKTLSYRFQIVHVPLEETPRARCCFSVPCRSSHQAPATW